MTGNKIENIFPITRHENKGLGKFIFDFRFVPKFNVPNTNTEMQ